MARQTKDQSVQHISEVPFKSLLVKLSTAHYLFNMEQPILTTYIVCFSIGLILRAMLIYRDAKPNRTNETNEIFRAWPWERILSVAFGLAQAALFVNDITAVSMSIDSTARFNWIDLSIPCTLQLVVCTTVRTPIRIRRLAKTKYESDGNSSFRVQSQSDIFPRLCPVVTIQRIEIDGFKTEPFLGDHVIYLTVPK